MDLRLAIESFCDGFCTTRSLTHPYRTHHVGSFWVMRDDPPRKNDPRAQEWVTMNLDASAISAELRSVRMARFFLCVIHGDEVSLDSVKERFKAIGFRAMRREPMMVKQPGSEVIADSPFSFRQVTDLASAQAVNDAARTRQILKSDLEDPEPKLKLFAAWDGDRPIGWVRSIRTHPDRAWVSNMYTVPAYRRKGVGSNLMRTMLREDHASGCAWSILLASTDGAKLYESLGYHRIGTLQLFAPIKSQWY